MIRGAPTSAALLFLPLATTAVAADVVSPAPAAVAVTVYRDQPISTRRLAALGDDDTHGLALVVETRDVDLPAGPSRLRFEGVADGIIPQSAGIEGLPARIIERDFDYDLLTPGALVAASVGETVERVLTDPRTGRETRDRAIIRSGPDGVALEVGGRYEALRCGGERERLVFDHAPPGLQARPTLSLAIDAPSAGRYRVLLSYLTVRMDWAASYIARVAPDGRTLALTGWITLANRTATAFANAPTEVVAGRLARAPVQIPRARTAGARARCWPMQTTHAGWLSPAPPPSLVPPPPPMNIPRAMAMAAPRPTVAAQKLAIESQLGDYKLYTLAEPTTVAARQTKQVLFLSQPSVTFETVYADTVEAYGAADTIPMRRPTQIVLRLANTSEGGLGRPLPAGLVQIRQAQAIADGRELLLGQPFLPRDIPVGEPFELRLGVASDVTVIQRLAGDQPGPGGRVRRTFEVLAANARSVPAAVEVRHDRAGAAGFKVVAESAPHGDKAGDPLWRLTLPPAGEQTLRYTVEYARRDRGATVRR